MERIQEYILGLLSLLGRMFGKRTTYQPVKSYPLTPLKAIGWRLLVDASNLAYRNGEPRLEYLLEALKLLDFRFEGAKVVLICDANLPYVIGGEKQIRRSCRNICANFDMKFSGQRQADAVLLALGKANSKTIIVSNDWFGKGEELGARLNIPRLGVSIKRGHYVLDTQVVIFEHPHDLQKHTKYPIGQYINTVM